MRQELGCRGMQTWILSDGGWSNRPQRAVHGTQCMAEHAAHLAPSAPSTFSSPSLRFLRSLLFPSTRCSLLCARALSVRALHYRSFPTATGRCCAIQRAQLTRCLPCSTPSAACVRSRRKFVGRGARGDREAWAVLGSTEQRDRVSRCGSSTCNPRSAISSTAGTRSHTHAHIHIHMHTYIYMSFGYVSSEGVCRLRCRGRSGLRCVCVYVCGVCSLGPEACARVNGWYPKP
jgi:hypothetical protein